MKKLAVIWAILCVTAICNAAMLEIHEDYTLFAGEYTYDYVNITAGVLTLDGDVTIICNGVDTGYFYGNGDGIYGNGGLAITADEIIITSIINVQELTICSSGNMYSYGSGQSAGGAISAGGTINVSGGTVNMTGGSVVTPEPMTLSLLGLGMVALRRKKRKP